MALPKYKDEWDLTNPPPDGHRDVAAWAYGLFEVAYYERERLGLEPRWMLNYKLYRGRHFDNFKDVSQMVELNLFFANVERTRANITARNPSFEVIDMSYGDEGSEFDAARLLTAHGRKWWQDTKQRKKLASTALVNEIYGVTVEKAYWNAEAKQPDIGVIDPFSFFPAPGYYEDISLDAPYVCHAYPDTVEAIEKAYGVDGVNPSDVYSILGEEREESRRVPHGMSDLSTARHYGSNITSLSRAGGGANNFRERRCLVVEVWVRDYTIEEIDQVVAVDTETGIEITKKVKRLKYPGGVRVITVTNNGELLLSDVANPNINAMIDRRLTKPTYLYNRFPFAKANSYEDSTSIWGFSAAEQVGDLNFKINQLISRMVAYVNRSMFPPLIIPLDCKIPASKINNLPNLLLSPPDASTGNGIRFVPVPALTRDFFEVFNLLINLFDRIYQIEDADRGATPGNVVAASAIIALQERNAVLIQQKIGAIDALIEFRGQAFVSFNQNFGINTEAVEIEGDPQEFRPIEFAGRKFNFVVEAGSTMPKTSLQIKEEAKEAYAAGAIDRQAYLEAIDFPNAKEIIERVGEGQLGQALQILIQAGLPEEYAMQLQEFLMQNQGGPGNRKQTPPAAGSGTQNVQGSGKRQTNPGNRPQMAGRA